MKRRAGFTLVELMVVIGIVALLLTWGIPAFSTWDQKHTVESEMVQLYGDLQFARLKAYSDKTPTGITWSSSSSYQIWTGAYNTDGTFNNNGVQIGAGNFKYAVTGQTTLSFDCRGFLDPNNTDPVSILVTPGYGSPTDCVTVSLTRISLGKWDGQNCNPQQ